MVFPLFDISPGETAEIVWVISEPPMAFHLEALGFTASEQVTCIIKGRRGCMSAYKVRGTVIALRTQNAREVLVKPV